MDSATTAAVQAVTVTLFGVSTGLRVDMLLGGFAGGLVSLSYQPPSGLWRRVWTPVTAALVGGYCAPVVRHYLTTDTMAGLNLLPFEVFIAFALGLTAHSIIPSAMRYVSARCARILRRHTDTREG